MSSQPPWRAHDEHPRDVFDEVPEDGPRQGAHRPRNAARQSTPAGLKAMVVVGSLGLLLGAGGYVYSTVNGEQRGLEAGATPTASPSPAESAAPEPEETASETIAPEDAEQVGVFNATSLDGVSGAAGSELAELDWEIIATGNWGLPVSESVVYYADDGVTGDTEEQAQRIADAMGIEQTQADNAIAYPLVVVVGDDIGQDVLDRSGGQAPPAENAPSDAGQGADAVLPEEQAEAPADDLVGGPAGSGTVDDGVAGQPVPADPGEPAAPALPADPALPAPAEGAVPGAQAPADQAGGL